MAQSAEMPVSGPSWVGMSIVLGIGVLLLTLIVILLLVFRHLRMTRQCLHTERIRSIEAGFPVEVPDTTKLQAKFLHNAFWIAFWIVFGVPAAAFSAAATATRESNASLGLGIVIWIGAAAASVASVICATLLMIYARSVQATEVEGPRKFSQKSL